MAGKTEYKNTWQRENVDRVNLTMPKGRKDIIKAHAEAQGESVNGFINRAIDNQISQDRDKGPPEALQGTSEVEKIPAGDIKPLRGSSGSYRLRVGGWRILFSYPEDGIILIEKVGPRGDVYKGV